MTGSTVTYHYHYHDITMGSVATLVPDKKLDRFCPKQKNPIIHNNLAYHPGPVSPPGVDSSSFKMSNCNFISVSFIECAPGDLTCVRLPLAAAVFFRNLLYKLLLIWLWLLRGLLGNREPSKLKRPIQLNRLPVSFRLRPVLF